MVRSNDGLGGILSKRIRVSGLTSQGNGWRANPIYGGGVESTGKLRIQDGILNGNTVGGVDADVISARRPVLLNTSCLFSLIFDAGVFPGSWSVCTQD
jgi:hypothetical protein